MSVINIGNEAIDRNTHASYNLTLIDGVNTANASGHILSVDVYAKATIINAWIVIFYRPNPGSYPNHFTARDREYVGAVAGGVKSTFEVDLEVEIGDHIGIYYYATGELEMSSQGGLYWNKGSNHTEADNVDFGSSGDSIMSLGATGFTPTPYIAYGEWVKFITAAPGLPGAKPSGYKNDVCSDQSGYSYILNRSLTDDGASYESYFVLSTDLSGKKTLHTNKRLLDIFSYFANKGTGTAKIYVRGDTEPSWQYAGEVSLAGEDEIIIRHLPSENEDTEGDVDFLAKTFLIKFVFENDFEFIGMITEAVPIGDR